MNRIVTMVLKNIHIAPGAFVKLWRYAANPEKYEEMEMWNHIHYIMNRAVMGGNVDLKVTGLENLPEKDGFMLYGNHQGMFDVVAIAGTWNRPLAAVLKKELENVPLLKQIRLCTKSFCMDREDVRQSLEVIQNVTREVQNGRNYLIFPEGTRSKNGNVMGEFHGGSFRCAVKAKCPIVPVALIDSYKVLDQKGSAPVSVQLHYLKPIAYEEFAGMKATEVAAMMKLPDYRSGERTFQLLTQVAGRAGRAEYPGEVFLQTYDPENTIIESAARQDYRAFYEEEMHRRKVALYPPYTLIARLLFEAEKEERARAEAESALRQMEAFFERRTYLRKYVKSLRVMPCPVAYIKGKARWQVTLKMIDQPISQEAVGKMSEIAVMPMEGCACVCQVNPSSMM